MVWGLEELIEFSEKTEEEEEEGLRINECRSSRWREVKMTASDKKEKH